MAYVYEIVNKTNGMRYIGSRKGDPIGDESYMGSSKSLKAIIAEEGIDNFLKVIVAKYATRGEAYEMEIWLQRLYKVVENPLFYNKSYQTTKKFSTYGLAPEDTYWYGKSFSENHKANISTAKSCWRPTEELRQKWSKNRRGKKKPIGHCKGDKNPMYGKRGEDNPLFNRFIGDKSPRYKEEYNTQKMLELKSLGHSYQEIATILNCSLSTAWRRLNIQKEGNQNAGN